MKKITTAIIALLFLQMVQPASVSAQKMKIVSGNFDFLKGQKELNITFDYEQMSFYNDKLSADEYVSRREKEITENKGKTEAENWKSDWEYSKTTSFPNKFMSTMNGNLDMETSRNPNAPYTLIVETIWIYPGWYAAVMKQHSKVSTRLKFVETANPSQVLLTITSDKAPGDINFVGIANNNDRIAEGYGKTGKSLAKMILKNIK